MDLYRYVSRQNAKEAREFMKYQLIPQLPNTAQREIVLCGFSCMQLAAEDHIAQIVGEHMASHMPRTYGVYDVSIEDPELASLNLDKNVFTIQGLLMEEALGEPFAQSRPSIVNDEIVRSITQRLVLFQLELWRHNLRSQDANPNNLLLNWDSRGNIHLTIVDYGAISFVIPDGRDVSAICVRLPSTKATVQLPTKHYTKFFDTTMEEDIVAGLIGCVARPSSVLNHEFKMLLSQCFYPPLDQDIDHFIWFTVMLHIIHSCEQDAFHRYSTTMLGIVRRAAATMVEAHSSSHSTQQPIWWVRSVRNIAALTESDPDMHKA